MLRLGFSSCLQHRVFTIPWVKRTPVTRTFCLDQQDYSSLGLVRYVPEKSRKINENVTSEPVNGYEKEKYADQLDLSVSGTEVKESILFDLKDQKQARKHRKISSNDSRQGWVCCFIYKIATTNLYGCVALSTKSEEGNKGIRFRGNELTRHYEEVCNEIGLHTEEDNTRQSTSSKQDRKTALDAENMAIQLLGLRAYSAAELKKKLIGKRFPPEIVDGVIKDFHYRGLINDGLYAESFSRSRWSSSAWGPRRIKQALYKKGVSNADTDAAIKQVFEDGEDDRGGGGGNEELKHGLSKKAMEQLYVQASKQWLRGRDAPTETRKGRLVRWLQYRGFNWGVIGFILKRLSSTFV
ncbi:PREDICTED: uncharacterized protein LOC104801913 isoform X2 [Tarenaya hassleriana]|uniref:uncharacterized protein LOC104801913 isoform X2 n=1 Tax=Tarenaya hassleriana TaxID=28532 RepID=UPI00053C4975|nr:PREDICTED: uncharacterized protein LOC104801913 isoform X2 [Tarenaya hassleriana]XP_010523597.1 PREDICTED: uncharacterized protein LOC104801913 isoform X2 [Tarenaya hassleriana]